jgi:hypothetical protein
MADVMRVLLVVGVALTIGTAVWGALRAAKSAEQRRRVAIELSSLAFLAALGIGVLHYFASTPWAEGVATGLFSVCVYDLVRFVPSVLTARTATATGGSGRR